MSTSLDDAKRKNGATAQEEVMDSDNLGIAPRKNDLLCRLWPRRNMAVAKCNCD